MGSDIPAWVFIAVSLIAAIPPTLVAYAALRKGKETKDHVTELTVQVDGRLTQLLEETSKAARLAGIATGVEDERTRDTNHKTGEE